MATPNYSYEKRQKELAKKRKKEDKLKRKGEGRPEDGEAGEPGEPREVAPDGVGVSEEGDTSTPPANSPARNPLI